MMKFIVAVVIFLTIQVQAATNSDAHEELRALIGGIEKAINEERYSDLKEYFSKDMKVTAINQEFLAKHEDIVPYFQKWFGENGKIKKLEIKLTADKKTKFYSENIGIVYGKGEEKYILSDTRKFDMLTRWTATVIKDDDGKWRILTLHIGTDFLNNPLLSVAENSLKMFALIGLGVGLLLGLILGAFIWRRKRRV